MPVFVEHYDVGAALGFEPGDEVLADEAGATGEDDFFFVDRTFLKIAHG